AHLCRCTGWRTIVDAWRAFDASAPAARDIDAAARRAAIEGGCAQQVGVGVALGGGGFADDIAPEHALVAVLDRAGEWVVADTLASFAPDVVVEEVDIVGPPTSAALRAAGWAEMALLTAGLAGDAETRVVAPNGASASASVTSDGTVGVTVDCGAVLDETVL